MENPSGYSLLYMGGADAICVVAEGREYSKLSPAQIEAISRAHKSKVRAKEDKLTLMKEIEDEERVDAHLRRELDARLKETTKPTTSDLKNKSQYCESTATMQVGFCGKLGEVGIRGKYGKNNNKRQNC